MRITESTLQKIIRQYGWCASWAIWTDEGETPKSNIGDLSVFNFEKNPKLRESLHSKFIAVGLNISSNLLSGNFSNFHSNQPTNNDYKLRYAFRETPVWGCYMTDILKNFPEPKSGKVMKYIKENPESLSQHFEAFVQEIDILGAQDATFLGLGGDAFTLLKKALPNDARIIPVRHYSDWRKGKQHYREELLEKLDANGLT
jgi:hypothetical protein